MLMLVFRYGWNHLRLGVQDLEEMTIKLVTRFLTSWGL